ncbi:45769_t:CDS:1, partial [Gigaspora margarita]
MVFSTSVVAKETKLIKIKKLNTEILVKFLFEELQLDKDDLKRELEDVKDISSSLTSTI